METIRLPGRVVKIVNADGSEHAQIAVDNAGVLYDELRIANKHNWVPGEDVLIVIKKTEQRSGNGNSRDGT